MKIAEIRELAIKVEGLAQVSNAVVNLGGQTSSLVAVVSDVIRNGKPLIGFAFNSLGRFAQTGILQERVIPRVLAAGPDSLLAANGRHIDAAKVLAVANRNEKPGAHGDRASAAGAVELAIWDLNAKLDDEPAHAAIARVYGCPVKSRKVDVYATGGFYYGPDQKKTLSDELRAYASMGFSSFKIKVGGAPLAEDLKRIEEALKIAGEGGRLAVDANCRFDLATALSYAKAMAPYKLRWFEEIGDPLDYALNAAMAEEYAGAIATGENLHSLADARNLVNFGGMRPGRDIFQFDPGLSYGVTEYARILELMEAKGFSRKQAYPHGGHLINLHIALGLDCGGTEAISYEHMFQPFAGFSPECVVQDRCVQPSDAPGFGLEQKRELQPFLAKLAGS